MSEHHTSRISSPSVTRDDAGVYEYAWSSKHQHIQSVCLSLSRSILSSVRSHHTSCVTPPLVTREDAGVYEYASSSKHHHTFSKSVCLFESRPILNSVRSHLTSCCTSASNTRVDARCVRVRMVIKAPTHSTSRSVCP
jgi:hypothetical protein